MKFHLDNEKQGLVAFRHAWSKCLNALKAGKQFQVEIKYKSRSNEQNDKFHAMIAEIAQQAQHLGAKWSPEDWKRLLVDQFCKDAGISHGKVIPSLDSSGIVQLGFQTRDFTKEQASEFVEFLQAWATQNGVTLG
jgi:hypothetical protein